MPSPAVGNGAALRHQRAMVCGQGVGGALFAGKHARKHESGKCGKCVGQFCGELPARIDLQQCGSHVETRSRGLHISAVARQCRHSRFADMNSPEFILAVHDKKSNLFYDNETEAAAGFATASVFMLAELRWLLHL